MAHHARVDPISTRRVSGAFRLLGAMLLACASLDATAVPGRLQEIIRQQERSLPMSRCEHVLVDGAGRVTVIGGTAPIVKVTATLHAWAREEGPAHALLDNLRWYCEPSGTDTVRIGAQSARQADAARRGEDRSTRVDLRIEVPAKADVVVTTEGEVVIAGTGAITVRGDSSVTANHIHGPAEIATRTGKIALFDIAGALRAKTGGGPIIARRILGAAILESPSGTLIAEDVHGDTTLVGRQGRLEARRIAGDLNARTGNGTVTVADVAGSCEIQNQNGRIAARNMRGSSIRLKTEAGAISVTQPEVTPSHYELVSRYGRITVGVPLMASLAVELSSRTGRVDSPLAMADMVRDAGGHRLTGLLQGGKYAFKASSQSGSIRLSGVF